MMKIRERSVLEVSQLPLISESKQWSISEISSLKSYKCLLIFGYRNFYASDEKQMSDTLVKKKDGDKSMRKNSGELENAYNFKNLQ